MAQIVSDSFDGVAGTDLLAHNANWAALSGATGTTSIDSTGTRLRQTSTSTGTTQFYRADAAPASADYSVSADVFVSNNTGTGATGPVGRASATAQTFYQARVINGTGVQLLRVIAGATTTLGTFAMTLANNQIVPLKLEMIGSTINVYVNGSTTPDISATDTNIPDVGYPGVRFLNVSSGQLRLENFSADQGAAAPASYTLAAAQGSYAISGQPIVMRAARRLVAAAGSYSITGQPAGMVKTSAPEGVTLAASGGSYAITGNPITMRAARRLVAASGAYSLTGFAVAAPPAPVLFATVQFRQFKTQPMRVIRLA